MRLSHNEVTGSVTGTVVQARDIHVHSSGKVPVVPRQLVAPPRFFTGRKRQLTVLAGTLDRSVEHRVAMTISTIGGAGGIGKTALALHWAHRNLARFPDGQLFVNLRGFDPSNEPTPPVVAMRGFLDALGVEPGAVPRDLDTQAALYRSLVAGKRMLVILDNARSCEQVVPLLPGSPSCTVLVTSRYQLASLATDHGAAPVDLDVLSDVEARDLFSCYVGAERVDAEHGAVSEVLRWCAGLPIAISIVAARAARYPGFPLAALHDELLDESALTGWESGDLTARLHTIFSWSYNTLAQEQAEVFAFLGLVPGPDISLCAAASLTALPVPCTRRTLARLVDASLIEQPVPGRYRMHDLIRRFALERAHRDHTTSQHEAALRRVVDFFLHTALAGDRLLYPHRQPIQVDPPAAGCLPAAPADHAAAMAWFDAEHPSLNAAQRAAVAQGWHRTVWQLAWARTSFQLRRGHLDDDVSAWHTGTVAAERLNDPTAQSIAHRCLGHAYARADRYLEATDHLHQALLLAERTHDRYNRAHALWILAWLSKQQGDVRSALEHATEAKHLLETFDNPAWRADALSAVGWYAAHLREYHQARTHCDTAVLLHRAHHNRNGEADTLDTLGYIAHHTGRHADSIDYYQQALDLRRELGNTYETANTLDNMGQLYLALHRQDEAIAVWREALRLYRTQHRVIDTNRVQAQLNGLDV